MQKILTLTAMFSMPASMVAEFTTWIEAHYKELTGDGYFFGLTKEVDLHDKPTKKICYRLKIKHHPVDEGWELYLIMFPGQLADKWKLYLDEKVLTYEIMVGTATELKFEVVFA